MFITHFSSGNSEEIGVYKNDGTFLLAKEVLMPGILNSNICVLAYYVMLIQWYRGNLLLSIWKSWEV